MSVPDWQIDGALAKLERDAVMKALETNKFNIAHAALQLKIGRTTIHRMMKRYRIQLSDEVKLYARAPAKHGDKKITFDGAMYVFEHNR